MNLLFPGSYLIYGMHIYGSSEGKMGTIKVYPIKWPAYMWKWLINLRSTHLNCSLGRGNFRCAREKD